MLASPSSTRRLNGEDPMSFGCWIAPRPSRPSPEMRIVLLPKVRFPAFASLSAAPRSSVAPFLSVQPYHLSEAGVKRPFTYMFTTPR